jgi:hypothetical protein
MPCSVVERYRVRLKHDGTRWRTGEEVKEKLAIGEGSQYSHTTSERGVCSITNADAHTSAASSRLNWRPRRLKWTRPLRRKTKSGFCVCAITFQTHYTTVSDEPGAGVWPQHFQGQTCDFLLLVRSLVLFPLSVYPRPHVLNWRSRSEDPQKNWFFYQIARHHISKDSNMNVHLCSDLRYSIFSNMDKNYVENCVRKTE